MDLQHIRDSIQNGYGIYSNDALALIAEVERITEVLRERTDIIGDWKEKCDRLQSERDQWEQTATNLLERAEAAEAEAGRLQSDKEELYGETEQLKERVNELDGIAYTNGELYNKEYLKREETEVRLRDADSMTAYWRVQYTRIEADRDKYKTALEDLLKEVIAKAEAAHP